MILTIQLAILAIFYILTDRDFKWKEKYKRSENDSNDKDGTFDDSGL